jgi:hypothetical protein
LLKGSTMDSVNKRRGGTFRALLSSVVIGLACTLAGMAGAQDERTGQFEIALPAGTPRDVLSPILSPELDPLWCGSRTVAYPAQVIGPDGRQQTALQLFTLGQSLPVIRRFPIDLAVAACADGGAAWLGYANGGDAQGEPAGRFTLVTAAGQQLIAPAARLLGTDSGLRQILLLADSGAIELVSTLPMQRRIIREPTEPGRPVAAGIDRDGTSLALLVSSTVDRRRPAQPATVSLIVTDLAGTRRAEMPLRPLLQAASRVEGLFFSGEELVINAATFADRLVVARCPRDVAASDACRAVATDLDAAEFEAIGVDGGEVIVASAGTFRQNAAARACVFKASFERLRLALPPPSCRLAGAPLPVYGPDSAPKTYALAPDRRHLLVRTLHRAKAPPADTSLVSQWAVVPASSLAIR